MAKLLMFTPGDSDKFDMMVDAFFGAERVDRNSHVAHRIIDKIEAISDQKYQVADLGPDILSNFNLKMKALAIRVLKDSGGPLILDDREFEYLIGCVATADWKHYAVKQGKALEEWMRAAKSVKLERVDGVLKVVE